MKRITLALLALTVISCSLWQPYGAMQAPPTVTAETLTVFDAGKENTPAPATPTPHNCTVTAPEALNLRSGPGIAYSVTAWLSPGDLLTVIDQAGAWLQVIDPSSLTGWVHSAFVECAK